MVSQSTDPRQEIMDEVRDAATREWGIDGSRLEESTRIADLPDMDSVKQLRMVALVEQRTGARIVDENTKPAETIGGFVDQVVAARH